MRASRAPFPFARVMRGKFNLCSVVTASRGPHLQNLDGNWTIDVSGSYGLNVFHMSGTEAVMGAARMARFNTRRKLIVCFSGAYHGWWDGVQPGLGSERPLEDCLTLKDVNTASLSVIRRRAKEIAGVLVNPIQSFHPNSPPPNDAVLIWRAPDAFRAVCAGARGIEVTDPVVLRQQIRLCGSVLS